MIVAHYLAYIHVHFTFISRSFQQTYGPKHMANFEAFWYYFSEDCFNPKNLAIYLNLYEQYKGT